MFGPARTDVNAGLNRAFIKEVKDCTIWQVTMDALAPGLSAGRRIQIKTLFMCVYVCSPS